jgi:SAM-dependent methyltransferase
MNYLLDQYARVKRAIARGESLRDALAIKWYVQELMAEQICCYLRPGSSVLEVGCGGSLTLHFLGSLGHRTTGVDIDTRFVEYSSVLGAALGSSSKILEADAFDLPFSANSFDYVYSVGMLEHFNVPEQQEIVNEMCRVARQHIHLEIPNPHPLSTFYTIGLKSDEVHLPCNPGLLLLQSGCSIIEVGGRCVFNTLQELKENPPLLAFAHAQAPGLLKDTYAASDIARLCEAERCVSKAERLVYGFQVAWIAKLPEASNT